MSKINLEGLSREEKLQLLNALKEKKQRQLRARASYVPNQGQLEVHKSKNIIRIVAAGNGGGKTALAANELIWAATGFNPITEEHTKVPARIIVLLDAPSKVEDVWLTELRKWYPLDDECELSKNGRPFVSEIRFKNGSRVQFMFHLQEALAFEGIELTHLIADEPFPRHIWTGLARGARTKNTKPRFLIIGTPLGQPWIYEELWQAASKGLRPDIDVFRFSTSVNKKNLAEGYLEQFARNLSEKEIKIRLGGEFAHLEGLALAHLFKLDQHVVQPFTWNVGKPVIIAVDPHFNKPTTAVMVGATGNGKIYVLKEFSFKGAPTDIAAALREWYRGYKVLDIVVDSLGSTPMSGGVGARSFIQVMNDCGVRCRATTFNDKNDEDWILRIQDALEIHDNIPKLQIFNSCRGLINDIETVCWKKIKNVDEFKPVLDISSKDHLSCLKYALATNVDAIATNHRPVIKRGSKSPWSGS